MMEPKLAELDDGTIISEFLMLEGRWPASGDPTGIYFIPGSGCSMMYYDGKENRHEGNGWCLISWKDLSWDGPGRVGRFDDTGEWHDIPRPDDCNVYVTREQRKISLGEECI